MEEWAEEGRTNKTSEIACEPKRRKRVNWIEAEPDERRGGNDIERKEGFAL